MRRVGELPGYGLSVDIDHGDGWMTRYAHLSRADVREGEAILRAQGIGLTGKDGNTPQGAAPHLHFEVWNGKKTVNPYGRLGPTAYPFINQLGPFGP